MFALKNKNKKYITGKQFESCMMSLSCERFLDSVGSNKFNIINNIYLMMRLRLLSPVKAILVFLKLHPGRTMTAFSSGVCCMWGLKHMQRVGTELCRHNMMPLSRAQCTQSYNGKSRPQMMKNVGVPQENYGTKKIPLWALEARTELQLTTKKLSGKIFLFSHFFLPHIKSLSFPCEI